MSGNLPDVPVDDIVISSGKLVVATDLGVVVSADGGAHWSRLGTNLPTTLTVFPCAFTLLGPDDYSKFGLTEYWVRVFIAPVINSNPSIAYAN